MRRYSGKWSSFCVIAVLFAASGLTCPSDGSGLPLPSSSLTGLWSGWISGDIVTSTTNQNTSPPNPNEYVDERTTPSTYFQQIVFDDSGLPTHLPIAASGFGYSFTQQPVTAFEVGDTQTFESTSLNTYPTGAADTITSESTTTTTLTVIESELSADHFRVVYETTEVYFGTTTGTAAGFTPSSFTASSTGKLVFEVTAVDELVSFLVSFNNAGTQEATGSSAYTGVGTSKGTLVGTLAAD